VNWRRFTIGGGLDKTAAAGYFAHHIDAPPSCVVILSLIINHSSTGLTL
jgi:hypothetical protein